MEFLSKGTGLKAGRGLENRAKWGGGIGLMGFVFCLLFIGTPVLATTPGNVDVQRQLAEALAELRAADVEWRQNDADFRELRKKKDQTIQMAAVEEFAEFVASLHRKMLEACQKYRLLGGDPDGLGFKCPLPEEQETPSGSGQESAESPKMAKSDVEKMASAEDPFTKSLNEFDLWQQEKQEKVREEVASRKSTGTLGRGSGRGSQGTQSARAGTSSGGGSAGMRSDGPSPEQSMGGGMGADGRMAEAGAGPGVEKQEGKSIPRRKGGGGGSDDDVVARQLREAAEKEQDPVLKEKLWDEYRKYKASKR